MDISGKKERVKQSDEGISYSPQTQCLVQCRLVFRKDEDLLVENSLTFPVPLYIKSVTLFIILTTEKMVPVDEKIQD